MTKIKYLASLLVLVLLASCVNNSDDHTLTLSDENPIAFTMAEGSKSIGFVTDPGNNAQAIWVGENWGDVQIVGNEAVVTVTKNTNLSERKATVKILTTKGNLEKVIEVTQSGTAQSIATSIDFINIYHPTYDQDIFLTGNLLGFTVEAEGNPSWITITPDVENMKFRVQIQESSDKFIRRANILIKSGNLSKTIKVEQHGTLYYALPILFDPVTVHYSTLIESEKARNLNFSYYPSGIEDGPAKFQMFPFWLPESSPFRCITYIASGSEGWIKYSRLDVKDVPATLADTDLDKFLAQYGFEMLYNDTEYEHKVWWNAELNYEIDLCYKDFWGTTWDYLIFQKKTLKPDRPGHQVDSRPSLANLEMPLASWGATKAEVETAETSAKIGGEYTEGVWYVNFNANNSDGAYYRQYTIDVLHGGLKQITTTYRMSSIEKFMFRVPERWNDAYQLTKEFKKILADAGFSPEYPEWADENFIGTGWEWINPSKQLRIQIGLDDSKGILLTWTKYLPY